MENLITPSSLRERLFDCIDKRLDGILKGFRQNVAIVGPIGLGKTRLLLSIFDSIKGLPQFVPVFIPSGVKGFDHFAEGWIGSILSGLFLSQNVAPPEDFESLVLSAEPIVPNTAEAVKRIRKLMRQEKFAAIIKELFALPTILSEETGKKVILMIDEITTMEQLPVPDPFALLGKEIMVSKNTFYLVTSSNAEQSIEIFHHKLALLFGNFEILEICSFSFEETAKFLKERFPKRIFSEEQIKFMIRMTNGQPLYLDLLIDRIEMLIAENYHAEISNELLLDAFYRELLDLRGRIALLFEKKLAICRRLVKNSAPFIEVLLAISEGRKKALPIATYIGKKAGETKKILQKLMQEGLVIKNGSFYVIDDPLFKFWLKNVYRRRTLEFFPNPQNLESHLWNLLQDEYRRMKQQDKSELTARVEALFKEFRNDVVEINGKKVRFSNFHELAFKPSGGRTYPLYARSHSSRWLFQIVREKVSEEDITIFLEETRRFRKNVHRKIMIMLSGIDQNAKLMAQEAKIQLWDLRILNQLLDLYDLPKLIFVKKTQQEQNAEALGALA